MRQLAIVCALLLASCAPTLTGESFSMLTARGGPPRDVVPLPDGSRVYFWRDAGCELAATVDSGGTVIAYELTGASCEATRARFLLD